MPEGDLGFPTDVVDEGSGSAGIAWGIQNEAVGTRHPNPTDSRSGSNEPFSPCEGSGIHS